MNSTQELLVKREDACRMLNVSLRTLDKMTQAGQLPCIRLGKKSIRYSVVALEEWIAARSQAFHEKLVAEFKAEGMHPMTAEEQDVKFSKPFDPFRE